MMNLEKEGLIINEEGLIFNSLLEEGLDLENLNEGFVDTIKNKLADFKLSRELKKVKKNKRGLEDTFNSLIQDGVIITINKDILLNRMDQVLSDSQSLLKQLQRLKSKAFVGDNNTYFIYANVYFLDYYHSRSTFLVIKYAYDKLIKAKYDNKKLYQTKNEFYKVFKDHEEIFKQVKKVAKDIYSFIIKNDIDHSRNSTAFLQYVFNETFFKAGEMDGIYPIFEQIDDLIDSYNEFSARESEIEDQREEKGKKPSKAAPKSINNVDCFFIQPSQIKNNDVLEPEPIEEINESFDMELLEDDYEDLKDFF